MATERTDPYKSFRFRVEIQGIQVAAFSNATIPEESMDAIDYREGTDPYTRRLSGMPKVGTLSLKRGLSSSLELYEWWLLVSELGAGAPGGRKNVSVVVVDDAGNDGARWDMAGVWPTKYQSGDLDAKGGDVLIESLELALETIKRAR
ncbi:phage tail protein [Corallococcus llansteffanensis]|uniref:Phage tail protein n=1 Tax=Corallococcus llansteffanensis TaxID=2316731 RepID=A0A3A8NJS1_9BACT|nr:phage tail protein [Corallococcus llansteffanensis]RKH42421.1 phage tail protein [Corallococcus llansteffanensis]